LISVFPEVLQRCIIVGARRFVFARETSEINLASLVINLCLPTSPFTHPINALIARGCFTQVFLPSLIPDSFSREKIGQPIIEDLEGRQLPGSQRHVRFRGDRSETELIHGSDQRLMLIFPRDGIKTEPDHGMGNPMGRVDGVIGPAKTLEMPIARVNHRHPALGQPDQLGILQGGNNFSLLVRQEECSRHGTK